MATLKRILLKLSGESLSGKQEFGIDPIQITKYVNQIKTLHAQKIQIAIVIGGGNIFRGISGMAEGFDRVQGDYMGMMATVINSMALENALKNQKIPCIHLSGFEINPICGRMSRQRAIDALESNHVVVISAGTGNPFFTTDTAAALRAVEIKADALLKGTRVDGVYSDDPEKNPNAVKFDQLSFSQVLDKELHIMDLTAFTLCKENNMPIVVFDMEKEGNLLSIINGQNPGTLIN